MRIMEGQGVDGHVGGKSSPKRNAFVRVFEHVSLSSLFSLCRVLSCLVVCVLVCACVGVCVCWRAAHSPKFPSGELELNSLSGTANDRRNREHVVLDRFSNIKCVRYKGFFGEPPGPSEKSTWAFLGKQKIGDKRSTQHPIKMIMSMIKNTIFLGKIARLTTTSSPPCVDSTRRRVYVQQVSVYTGNTRTPVYTETC